MSKRDYYMIGVAAVKDYYECVHNHRKRLEEKRLMYNDEMIRAAEIQYNGERMGEKDGFDRRLEQVRNDYSEEIKKRYSPIHWRLDERLTSILNSPVVLTESDIRDLLESAKSYADLRQISGAAERYGLHVGLPTAEDEIKRFNAYLRDCVKAVEANLETQPAMLKLTLEGLEEIANNADTPSRYTVEAISDAVDLNEKYSSVGNRIAIEMEEDRQVSGQEPPSEHEMRTFVENLGSQEAEDIFAHRMARNAVINAKMAREKEKAEKATPDAELTPAETETAKVLSDMAKL